MSACTAQSFDAPASPAGREIRQPSIASAVRPCLWRGADDYPARLAARMGGAAPLKLWLDGSPARVNLPQIAFVGSRRTPAPLLEASRHLAARMSDEGWVVSSGCARGADTAAMEGGLSGAAGALGIPAAGLAAVPPPFAPGASESLTLLAIAPPTHAFNAGYAIRRNAVIASLADALVLVAAGWKSGSWYAVKQAIALGTPIFCLECGEETPDANAWLIARGLAQPIPSIAPLAGLSGVMRAASRRRHETDSADQAFNQPDLFDELFVAAL